MSNRFCLTHPPSVLYVVDMQNENLTYSQFSYTLFNPDRLNDRFGLKASLHRLFVHVAIGVLRRYGYGVSIGRRVA